MPDGTVWVERSDIGTRSATSTDGLVYDPATGTVSPAPDAGLPRAIKPEYTVLADGTLFVLDVASGQASVWNPRTHAVTAHIGLPALDAAGTSLLRDGAVLLASDRARLTASAQVFDPVIRGLRPLSSSEWADLQEASPHWSAAVPAADTTDVSPSTRISLAFSQPLLARSVNADSVVLFGPEGPVSSRLALVDGGRALFIVPDRDLYTGTHYTVFLKGLRTTSGKAVPFGTYGFATASLSGGQAQRTDGTKAGGAAKGHAGVDGTTNGYASQVEQPLQLSTGPHIDGIQQSNGDCPPGSRRIELCRARSVIRDGAFYPGRNNALSDSGGHWRTYRRQVPALGRLKPITREGKVVRALAATANGSVSGRILRIDDRPVANVTVSSGRVMARTDADGTFVLRGLPAGRQTLFVDGASASRNSLEYGSFEVGVDVPGSGTLKLPYNMYLPRVLPRDKVRIPSPTTREVVITHPDMPGLEIDIPAGTVIHDRNGRIVTELAIVPTPVDRAPFPTGNNYPVYFSILPGGAVIQSLSPDARQGIRIRYPNYSHAAPGTAANFWNYDDKEGWRIYGKGHVSADGRQFVPDEGVGLTTTLHGSFTLAHYKEGMNGTPSCGGCPSASAGDPVDLATGAFVHTWHDLGLQDITPLSLDRTYRSGDTQVRAFGKGMSSSFDWFLYDELDDYSQPKLVLPNLATLPFNPILGSPADSDSDVLAEWRYTGSQGRFYGATLQHLQYTHNQFEEHWVVHLRDGTEYWFQNEQHNLLNQIVDRFGNATVFDVPDGLLYSVTSPGGRTITFDYDEDNRIANATDGAGRTVNYTYDATGHLSRVDYPDGTHEQYTYDGDGNLLTVVDRRGHTALTNQYAGGKVTKQTYADNTSYTFTYVAGSDGYNTQATVTDPTGSQRITVFDPASHYAASETLAAGTPLAQTTTFTRNAAGYVTSMTDALNRRTTMIYDELGDLTSVTALAGTPMASTQTFTYTPDDHLVATVTDPLNHATTFSYTDGCMTGITDALGHSTTITCNAYGQPVSITDPLGHTVSYGYDGYALRTRTDALGRVTTFTLDGLGRPIATQDAQGHVVRRTYDLDDRVVETVDPRGKAVQYAYDANGNLVSVTLPGGGTIGYTYDARNRPIQRTDALGQSESWTYDGLDHVLTTTDRQGQTTTYHYDALGRRDQVTYADGGTVAIGYDAGNRVTLLDDSRNGALHRDYDSFDRLVSESGPQGSIDYAYDAAGRRTQMTAGSQASVTYGYDAVNRLTTLAQGGEQVGYTYDDASRRATLTLPNGIVASYSYDAANQLTGIGYALNGTSLGTLSYGYDTAGRLVQRGGTLGGTAVASATGPGSFDANNRQTVFDGATLSYDADGHLTDDGTRSYVWNARGQLVQVKQGGTATASYAYDALGRRVSKQIDGGAATAYLYDGLDVVQETQGGTQNPLLTGLGVDERYARNEGGTRAYFLTDLLGSTVGLTDGSGAWLQQYSYDPYGVTTATTATSNPYQYTGRENDGNGLYYYRSRYYSPAMGRFLSEDPIGLAGGLNGYAYVGDQPTDLADPSGNCPWCIGAVIGGGFDLVTQLAANGGNLHCVNWWEVGASAGLGALGGGFGGSELSSALRGISNTAKGEIGETLSIVENRLAGSTLVARNEATISGLTTQVDSTWMSFSGDMYFVESKFGMSTLTRAQRVAKNALGDSYKVERWGYPFFERVGAYGGGTTVGSMFGSKAGNGGSDCGCP
ncbi:hypothetical protein BV497_09855 [Fulvimonas soli]|nr:hypothetical protein BV497_09855 [Fulvimonas soli]